VEPSKQEQKMKCLMCAKVFTTTLPSENKKAILECPQCDSTYVVDFLDLRDSHQGYNAIEEEESTEVTTEQFDGSSNGEIHAEDEEDSIRKLSGKHSISPESTLQEPRLSIRNLDINISSIAGLGSSRTITTPRFNEILIDPPETSVDKDQVVIIHPNTLLYFNLNLFQNEKEQFCFFLRTTYVRHAESTNNVIKERGVFLVVSTHALYFLIKKKPKQNIQLSDPFQCLKLAFDPLPFADLLQIKVGLGWQSLCFYFSPSGSTKSMESYVLLFRDSRTTSELVNRLSQVLSKMIFKPLKSGSDNLALNLVKAITNITSSNSGLGRSDHRDNVEVETSEELFNNMDTGSPENTILDDDNKKKRNSQEFVFENPFFKDPTAPVAPSALFPMPSSSSSLPSFSAASTSLGGSVSMFSSNSKNMSSSTMTNQGNSSSNAVGIKSSGDKRRFQDILDKDFGELIKELRDQILYFPEREDNVEDIEVLEYYLAYSYLGFEQAADHSISVVITRSWLFLCEERQIPYAVGDQSSNNNNLKNTRFVRKAANSIIELLKIETVDGPFYRTRLIFNQSLDEETSNEREDSNWDVLFVSRASQTQFVNTVSSLWKAEFKVDLEIQFVSL